jgi:mRNA-degrading endonuclease RelE of RelBE toxin-antitoxin system
MSEDYELIITARAERDIKRFKNNSDAIKRFENILEFLSEDPYNLKGFANIRKLVETETGEGRFRIRSGNYRCRYDVIGNEVIIYSFKDRKEIYRQD